MLLWSNAEPEYPESGLLNAECFDKMKPTAYVINTARGPIVDQAALIDALRKKKIAGAALDVFGEGSAPPPPLPDDSPLYDAVWCFGTFFMFIFHILGMSSSQLTKSNLFQRG